MSLLNPFNGIEKRSHTNEQVSPVNLFSLVNSGYLVDISGQEALKQSDIFTAVRIIAGDLAAAEVKAEGNDYISDLLNKQTSYMSTAYNFKFVLFANMLLNENSYAAIERDRDGKVIGLRNILPSQVLLMQSEDGRELGYQISEEDGRTNNIAPENMIHVKPFSLDGKTGISPLMSLKPETNMLRNGNNLLASFFQRGINLGGILKLKDATLDNKSKKKIRESFEEANAGTRNQGTVMVLDETQEFTQLEVDTKVLEMIQNNKYSTQQIAKVFGIPISRFGQELTNTSEQKANDIYITSTLNMYSNMIIQEFNRKLDANIKLDFSVLKGMDKETLFMEMMKKDNGDGVLKKNEVRRFYGLPSIPDGEDIYENSASRPLSVLKEKEVES